MRKFNSIASLIKSKRLSHPQGLSQSDLSHLLGYKNGQFISNVERALCNIPFKMMNKVCDILHITPEEIKNAMLADYNDTIEAYFVSNEGFNEQKPQLNETVLNENSSFVNNAHSAFQGMNNSNNQNNNNSSSFFNTQNNNHLN